jgi:hypothetical protein
MVNQKFQTASMRTMKIGASKKINMVPFLVIAWLDPRGHILQISLHCHLTTCSLILAGEESTTGETLLSLTSRKKH